MAKHVNEEIPVAPAEPPLPILDTEEALHEAITDLAKLKGLRKALELDEERKQQQVIDSIFARGDVDYLIPNVVKVVIQSRTTRVVDRALLIGLGADPDMVDAATTVNTSKPFVRLYPQVKG